MAPKPILKSYTVGSLAVKAYLIGCPRTKEAIIVDPAGSEAVLAKEIAKAGLTLKAIVNSHGHPDHTCGNRKMQDLTKAPVLMHPLDDALFRRPDIAAMFRGWGFDAAPPADGFLADGEILEVGDLKFEILHTPGHSPGSVCLFGQGLLVTGDTLFVGAVGRTDLPGGDFSTLIESLRTRLLPLPDETTVLPGHDYGSSPTSTMGREKRTNPYITDYCGESL